MEKNIQQMVDQYQLNFKQEIKRPFDELGYRVVNRAGEDCTSDLFRFIFDYDNIQLKKEDFQKRKRVKHAWALHELCVAQRANGQQCTRRMRDLNATVDQFCGTHCKGQPHGLYGPAVAAAAAASAGHLSASGANYAECEHQHQQHMLVPIPLAAAATAPLKRLEVWVQEIKGINYYIDEHHNVYKPDDIIANRQTPHIIAKWAFNDQGGYCIPSYNI